MARQRSTSSRPAGSSINTMQRENSAVSISSRKKEDDAVSSRRATLSIWRTEPVFARKSMIGDPLPEGWIKAKTEEGTPYYINHVTKETQWTDPRLESCFEELNVHNDIRLAVYRTATKLRDLQVYTRSMLLGPLSKVQLSTALNSFYALEISHKSAEHHVLTAEDMATVLLEVYSDLPYPQCHVEIMVSWMLKAYDRMRTGRVPLQAFKVALALLCVSWIEEKYRYAFATFDTNEDGYISREQMRNFLTYALMLIASFREAYPFGPQGEALELAIDQCLELEHARSGMGIQHISLETFVQWCMKEPRPLVWLPTLHRIGATENVKHDSVCCVCKMYPIIGFRYKNLSCMDKDVCQECYWTGREGNGHKNTHQVREYCFPSTAKEDVKDFFSRVKTHLSKRSKRKTELSAPLSLPMPDPPAQTTTAVVEPTSGTASRTRSQNQAEPRRYHDGLEDEHNVIESMAARLQGNYGEADGGPVSTMVVSLETEQKLHLLRVIDELDAENRNLLRQVMELQATEPVSPVRAPRVEADTNEALESRIQQLQRRNEDLVDQLARLQALLATGGLAGAPKALEGDANGAEDDEDEDEEEEEEDWSAEPELFILADAIETGFAELRDKKKQAAELHDPTFNKALAACEDLAIALRVALANIANTIAGHVVEVPPETPELSPTTRRRLWGDNAALLEEQAKYQDTPMPSGSIKRQRASLRHSTKKLRAQLDRLSAYSTHSNDLVMAFDMAAEPAAASSSVRTSRDSAVFAPAPPSTTMGHAEAEVLSGSASLPLQQGEASDRKDSGSPTVLSKPPPPLPASDDEDDAAPPPPRLQGAHGSEPQRLFMSGSPTTHLKHVIPTSHEEVRSESELIRHVKEVHDPAAPPRRLSEERVLRNEKEYQTSLLSIRHTFERQTHLELRHVTTDNVNQTLLPSFADGYLLCFMANIPLQAANLPKVHPVRPAHFGSPTTLSRTQVLTNFNQLATAWRALNYHIESMPTSYDFQMVEDEASKPVVRRVHTQKIVRALEALLGVNSVDV